jgi:hypothetical protein
MPVSVHTALLSLWDGPHDGRGPLATRPKETDLLILRCEPRIESGASLEGRPAFPPGGITRANSYPFTTLPSPKKSFSHFFCAS